MKNRWNKLYEYRWYAILSSLILLLPMLAGVLFWNGLPEWMPIHWDGAGNPDGYALKWIGVFGLPLVLLLVHWLALFLTLHDPGNERQNKKVLGLVFWIVPVVSLAMNGLMYTLAMNHPIPQEQINALIFGLLFVVFGNYMPKIRRNSTLGIRVPWTLNSDENWNKTHRFASKLWIAAGIAILVTAPMPTKIILPVMIVGLLAAAVIPLIYSYRYAKKYESA